MIGFARRESAFRRSDPGRDQIRSRYRQTVAAKAAPTKPEYRILAATFPLAHVMTRNRWLILAIVLVLGWQFWTHRAATSITTPATGSSASRPATSPPLSSANSAPSARHNDSVGDDNNDNNSASDGLPAEARTTLKLIASGGPFPYDRDGVVFGNFEKRLPKQPRGYYHEYTVPTPGAHNRGARRIIAGGEPPGDFWYTDDHYETFRKIEAAR